MAYYCPNCGAAMDDSANFCPSCGAALNGTTADNSTLKTAATVGGVVLGASALSSLARSLTHRRRPPYMMDPGPRHGGPGGPGGGPHGGGRR